MYKVEQVLSVNESDPSRIRETFAELPEAQARARELACIEIKKYPNLNLDLEVLVRGNLVAVRDYSGPQRRTAVFFDVCEIRN